MLDQTQDEISLSDVVQFFVDSRRVVAIAALSCLGIGLVGFVALPDKYEATGTIQMASVAGQVVESPQVLLEKIKLPLYFSRPTWEKCDTDEELTPSRKVAEKIHPLLNKSAPFVSFTVSGLSVAEARECLISVIGDIKDKQDELANPALQQKKAQLKMLEEKLKQAEDIVKLFGSFQPTLNIKDEKFSSSALALATKLNNESSVKDLTNQIEDLKISLLPPQTHSTSLASPIYAPSQPANKKLLLTVSASLLAGLVLGVLTALVRGNLRLAGRR